MSLHQETEMVTWPKMLRFPLFVLISLCLVPRSEAQDTPPNNTRKDQKGASPASESTSKYTNNNESQIIQIDNSTIISVPSKIEDSINIIINNIKEYKLYQLNLQMKEIKQKQNIYNSNMNERKLLINKLLIDVNDCYWYFESKKYFYIKAEQPELLREWELYFGHLKITNNLSQSELIYQAELLINDIQKYKDFYERESTAYQTNRRKPNRPPAVCYASLYNNLDLIKKLLLPENDELERLKDFDVVFTNSDIIFNNIIKLNFDSKYQFSKINDYLYTIPSFTINSNLYEFKNWITELKTKYFSIINEYNQYKKLKQFVLQTKWNQEQINYYYINKTIFNNNNNLETTEKNILATRFDRNLIEILLNIDDIQIMSINLIKSNNKNIIDTNLRSQLKIEKNKLANEKQNYEISILNNIKENEIPTNYIQYYKKYKINISKFDNIIDNYNLQINKIDNQENEIIKIKNDTADKIARDNAERLARIREEDEKSITIKNELETISETMAHTIGEIVTLEINYAKNDIPLYLKEKNKRENELIKSLRQRKKYIDKQFWNNAREKLNYWVDRVPRWKGELLMHKFNEIKSKI